MLFFRSFRIRTACLMLTFQIVANFAFSFVTIFHNVKLCIKCLSKPAAQFHSEFFFWLFKAKNKFITSYSSKFSFLRNEFECKVRTRKKCKWKWKNVKNLIKFRFSHFMFWECKISHGFSLSLSSNVINVAFHYATRLVDEFCIKLMLWRGI